MIFKKRPVFIILGGLLGFSLFATLFFISAQAACVEPSPVLSGFALPCPVFSLSGTTVAQNGSLTLTAVPQAGTDYIYTTAYIHDGTAWKPYTLSGNNAYPGYSTAQAALTLTATQLSSLPIGTRYAVVWDWLWDTTAKCYKGPALNTCNTGQWRVQSLTLNISAPTPLPTAVPTPTPTLTGSATFKALDTITQGNWKTVYGSNGYNVINDTVSYPSYVTVTPSGQTAYTWTASTADVRALRKAASATDRIAATWFDASPFLIDLAFKDTLQHQVAIYFVDWDTTLRAETVDVLDANGVLLNTQNVANYHNGQYLMWQMSGHVQIRVTSTAGANGLVSGLFFDPVGPVSTSQPTPTPTPTTTPTPTPTPTLTPRPTPTPTPSSSAMGCSGSGLVFNCTAGSTPADVNAALTGAADGAVITFANGSYTWNSMIGLPTTKGATLICASAGGCAISSGSNNVFGVGFYSGVNNHFYRVSGFKFNPSGGPDGTIWFCTGGNCNGTFTQIRIDHNTFTYPAGGVAILLGENASISNFYGVIDHNTMTSPVSSQFLTMIGRTNPSPPPSPLGTANSMFVEDNTISITTTTNSGDGCMDGWGGDAIVWRHNTTLNCLVTSHGATHAGGPQNIELYDNNMKVDAGSVAQGIGDGYRLFHHQGSGEFIAFGNSFTAFSGKNGTPLAMADYRAYANSVDGGAPICDGTVTNPPAAFSDGNRSPLNTYRGYPCWHQPGRDFAGNLMPMYAWNNYWSDTGAQIKMNVDDFGGSPDYITNHLQANRDFYNAVSASAQTSPTSPFNGTTGMGFGTLANRPTTCSTAGTDAADAGHGGVGYFATDVGPQGTLYQCSAPNTWTVWYTPYAYPHPLQLK